VGHGRIDSCINESCMNLSCHIRTGIFGARAGAAVMNESLMNESE